MLIPPLNGGPQERVSSPAPGRSTLITSAPRSASSMVAYGPERIRVKSSTRIPASGRGIATRLHPAAQYRNLVSQMTWVAPGERRRWAKNVLPEDEKRPPAVEWPKTMDY